MRLFPPLFYFGVFALFTVIVMAGPLTALGFFSFRNSIVVAIWLVVFCASAWTYRRMVHGNVVAMAVPIGLSVIGFMLMTRHLRLHPWL